MVKPRMYSAFLITSILLISFSVQIIYALPIDWDVQLTASISNYIDDSIFGCMSGATDGFDVAYDSLDPPAAPTGVVSYFYYPNNPTSPINFQKLSISKTDHSSSQKIWTYIVKQNVADGTLTINWNLADILTIPEAYSVTLQGPSSEVVNMREITTHSFPSTIDIGYTFAIILEEIPPEMYYLSVNTVGNGVVTVNGSSPYDAGDVVMMTAYPDLGWTFEVWSGDLTGTANPDTILMDSNKSVTATFTEIPEPTTFNFDFGTSTSPVQSGYTRVTESTVYSPSWGYGWTDTSNVGNRDRGAPDSLRRDLVFSRYDRVFNVDLANGEYTVKLIIGDNQYRHDNIDVYAEGALMLDDVTVEAGSFVERVFGVVVSDGQLNLMFTDDGGTDVNWVINAIEVTPGPPPFWRGYDFGTATSPLEAGYIRISHYKSRDREAPDNNLLRDLIFDSSDATFVPWDIPNGEYMVTVTIGDQKYMHDMIDVSVEGTLMLDDVTVEAGQFKMLTFMVTLSDGELNIGFHDDGGTDINWIVNAITIEAAP